MHNTMNICLSDLKLVHTGYFKTRTDECKCGEHNTSPHYKIDKGCPQSSRKKSSTI